MEHTSPRRGRAPGRRRGSRRPRGATRAARRRTPSPSAPNAKTHPAPSRIRGAPSRMPGMKTPSTADSAHVPTDMTATSRSCASIRSAVCRRSSARRRASARCRSASICVRSISMRTLSRSKASLSAATTTPASLASSAPAPGADAGPGQALGGALPESPRDVDEASHRVDHGCPLCDAHWLSLKRECRGRKPGRRYQRAEGILRAGRSRCDERDK